MSCITSIASKEVYVQAGSSIPARANPYVLLSAPLVSQQLQQVSDSDPPVGVAGLTRKLLLTGATAFLIRVDASFATSDATEAYVSVGISTTDELVEYLGYTTSTQLPASTLRFNYADNTTSSDTNVAASAATFVTAVVPPGTYYVSSVGYNSFNDTNPGSNVVGTLSIEAKPIYDSLGVTSVAQNEVF